MDPLIVSVISIAIAVAMAAIQIRKYFADKRLAERADMEREFRGPAERDAIIISGAKDVVSVLRATLHDKVAEIDDLKARVRFLEQELARLHYKDYQDYKEGKPNEE